MPLSAFLTQRPSARCALTLQAAAWAHGFADRVPTHIEVAAATTELARQLPAAVAASVFDPHLRYHDQRGVPVLAPESVLVHMTAKPSAVRSWASALEWLPELAADLSWEQLSLELAGRPPGISARTGYLLQGMRPDLADAIRHIARHTPRGAGAQGRDAAIVDIAQDLLLRHLHGAGVLDALAFKGGTALRKL